jgi:siroheme synthase
VAGAVLGQPGWLTLGVMPAAVFTRHDVWVSEEILSLVPHDAVGKPAGGQRAPQLPSDQITGGRAAVKPVALIRDATQPEQIVQITALVDQTAATVPALVVPGPVVTGQQRLAAWERIAPMTVIHSQQQSRTAG